MNDQSHRAGISQQQFLDVVSKDEALARWHKAFAPRALPPETVGLAAALGRVLAHDMESPIDVPPFDRALVDGFALRAHDTLGASQSDPSILTLNAESLVCGRAPGPGAEIHAGTTTQIATGAMIPRGADCVAMVEFSEQHVEGIAIHQTLRSGQGIAFAGSDIARGEMVLARRTVLGARELGILAACGLDQIKIIRRPRVAVISTGDELVAPGEALHGAAIYDSNSAILSASITENGGEPVNFGVIRDNEAALIAAVETALSDCDLLVLSGGTSKGAGDLTHRIIANLGTPGIVVHGVALKPGKPLCLAVARERPIAVLPGFPTSAIVTFHSFVTPMIRAMAGLGAASAPRLEAVSPVRIASELGRSEFSFVTLCPSPTGLKAIATSKGSGAVTSFSQADGFVEIAALSDRVEAGATVTVNLITSAQDLPDLVIAGSHCVGLNALSGALSEQGLRTRLLALGSQAGLAMAKRGECDLAPIHLLDGVSGNYNQSFLDASLTLIPGWRRMQGLAYRKGDPKITEALQSGDAKQAMQIIATRDDCIMVNRNVGSGTRILVDGILSALRPPGWSNQPRSHNAVAAAIAQGRADWGVTIAPIAAAYDLAFAPLGEEYYDFALVSARAAEPAIRAFLAALRAPAVRDQLRQLGFTLP